jgi:hypothetical protein
MRRWRVWAARWGMRLGLGRATGLGWKDVIHALVIWSDLLHQAMVARALVISCQAMLRPGQNRLGLARAAR